MPTLAKHETCCGCSACYSACNFDAIRMGEDRTGFLYPTIDDDKCTNCGLCEKACPAINITNRCFCEFEPIAYVVRNINRSIRKESTSGGAFSAIAEEIIALGGVVFGAAFEENYTVRHSFAETVEELAKYRNSKYVQSEIGNSFKQCKEFLESGRYVCFSGTPCQITGLLTFLGRDCKKLVTVDIVCHSVPSPLIFRKYMSLQKEKYPAASKVVFRDKARGYSYSTMALYDKNESCLYRRGSESDLWFRSFLPGLCDRENCYDCEFQRYPRNSDLTIWDCFAVSSLAPEFDDNEGATSVVAWSAKAQEIIENNSRLERRPVPIEAYMNKINRERDNKLKIDREQFYYDAKILSPQQLFAKYRPDNIMVTIRRSIRVLLYRLGLYQVIKKRFG